MFADGKEDGEISDGDRSVPHSASIVCCEMSNTRVVQCSASAEVLVSTVPGAASAEGDSARDEHASIIAGGELDLFESLSSLKLGASCNHQRRTLCSFV